MRCMLRWQQNQRRTVAISRCRWQSSQQDERHEEKEEKEEDGILELAILCDAGHLDKAMELLDKQRLLLPQGTYWALLKLCNKRRSLHHAKHVHAHMAMHSMPHVDAYMTKHAHAHMAMHNMPPTITSLKEYLILTFVKCGDLESALQVFQLLHHRTVFSWTALISGYTDCRKGAAAHSRARHSLRCGAPRQGHGASGQAETSAPSRKGAAALQMYARMLSECVHPNEYTYVSLLKACGSIVNLETGKALHACAWNDGLHSHVIIASALVSMYGNCGAITDAEKTFFMSPQHDVVLWTSILSVLIEYGLVKKAINLYAQMQRQGVAPNEWTVSACLQGCCILSENKETLGLEGEPLNTTPLEIGWMLHTDACHLGFDRQVFVGNSLIRMYGKCGCTFEAENVFCSLSNHNVVSWTSMLSLYVEQGEAEKALKVYRQMQEGGANPDKLTFLITLQACCILAALGETNLNHAQSLRALSLEIGQALHADARRKCLDSDAFVSNTLVHLFTKCGKYVEAETVFAELCQRDVVSWTVMLPSYIGQGQARKALQLYQQMQKEGVSPDVWTYVNVLQACCKSVNEEFEVEEGNSVAQAALEMGKALHSDALERGFDHNMYFGSILVSVYGKCGSISEAEYCFRRLSQPDMTAYSVMMSAFVEESQGEKVLRLYEKMLTQGVAVNDAIHGCLLQSCSSTGSLKDCMRVHHSILWMTNSVSLILATGLIHAYGSCTSTSNAQAMLNSLSAPDAVSWNALIAGYVQGGDYAGGFRKFEEMCTVGINPNGVTFMSLLSSCCQIGLIQKGFEYFESMRDYNISPGIQHYGSMIDLLGRAGDFNRIEELLSTMQVQPDLAMWLGLLGACQVYGNVELGKRSYDQAVQLQSKQAAAYVLMSNMYIDVGLQNQANEVDLSRQNASAWKKPGHSWILVNDKAYYFVVKESAALREESLFHVLQQKHIMLRLKGHIPQTDHELSWL